LLILAASPFRAELRPRFALPVSRSRFALPQYVIARRVERAKQHLRGGGDLTLAQVAAHAGFSDQSQFCQHFKRVVGVTPGRFRKSAGIG
jgi:AraC-like DNA-binding protein